MKALMALEILVLGHMAFFVWYRRPAGRGFSHSFTKIPRSMGDFDSNNPDAPAAARNAFYHGVQAQLDGDYGSARSAYHTVLSLIPGEPTTRHNLSLL